jgi:ferritin-like metal-binding protein YciE
MAETSESVIRRYLEDAIAAEKSFETQLQSFANEGDDAAAKTVFHDHALQTRLQHERLTARLESLGGSTSIAKSIMAHVFNLTPRVAQLGHEKEEQTTQNLMMAYAVENSEIAMYEALHSVADAASDTVTAELARTIQEEERAAAGKIWQLLRPAALESYRRLSANSQ